MSNCFDSVNCPKDEGVRNTRDENIDSSNGDTTEIGLTNSENDPEDESIDSSENDPLDDNEAWNEHCDEMNAKKQADNGKSHLVYYEPRGFVLGESRATVEIIPVEGTEDVAETSPSDVQAETQSVREDRTEESESGVQSQQPAPPVDTEQNVQKCKNPFAASDSTSNTPKPVQQPNSTGTTTGADMKTESDPEKKQEESTQSEDAAVQKKSKNKNPLIEIVDGMNLYRDQHNKGYATIPRGLETEDVAIESEAFDRFLTLEVAKQGILTTAQKAAIKYANAVAINLGHVHPVHHRYHFNGNELVYDLNDGLGRIVIADKNGFRVEQKGRYKFRRTDTMKSMPEPNHNGDIKLLTKYVNVTNKYDEVLIISWIVAALMTNIDRPFLLLHGPSGSGKSTASNVLRGSIDPVTVEGLAMPRTDKDFNVSLSKNKLPSYDNITRISEDSQNLLCRVVTGGGDELRKLYSNGDVYSFNYKSTFILTAIPNPITRPDLKKRTISVAMYPFENTTSTDEFGNEVQDKSGYAYRDQLMCEFESEKSLIFGGILNTFVDALGCYDEMKKQINRPPRFGEFFAFASAVAEVTGYGKDVFAEAYKRSMRIIHGAESISDPLTFVLVDLLESVSLQNPNENEFVFKMSELYATLMEHVKTIPEIDPSELPRAANALSAKLKKINIRESHGWDMTISQSKRDFRRVTFRKVNEIL